MGRPVFKAFTNAQNYNAARGHLLEADQAFTEAQDDAESGDCEGALNQLRRGSFSLGQAGVHQDLASREGGEDLNHDALNYQSKSVFDGQKRARTAFNEKCFRVAGRARPPKAEPRMTVPEKIDWLEEPPSPVPGIPSSEMEEAIEATRTAEAEGPRLTITPAREDDGPDVGGRVTLEPGEGGEWAKVKRKKRAERTAAPKNVPPMPDEAFKPARKRAPGEKGETRTYEFKARSGKVCKVKIINRPDGCLLIDD